MCYSLWQSQTWRWRTSKRPSCLDPSDEVPYYQLAQAYGALGNAAGRQKALADFRRVRDQKPKMKIVKDASSTRKVAKQEREPNAVE